MIYLNTEFSKKLKNDLFCHNEMKTLMEFGMIGSWGIFKCVFVSSEGKRKRYNIPLF
jgi:hypothetical protein